MFVFTESQNQRRWKGPLEINSSAETGSLQKVARSVGNLIKIHESFLFINRKIELNSTE